jgi:bacillithiol biosynthesis cysteine-adding enzyme BshC
MQAHCKRHTDLPHTSKLFSDLLYHFDRVAQFYPHAPMDWESFQASAAAIDYPNDRRRELVAALREQNGDSPLLESLAQPGAYAVVTGQQVGLYSGPAYTIYKALTAVRLARQLNERGLRSVPIFWLATEDHDFAEVSSCWLFDAAHTPHLAALNQTNAGDRPAGGIEIEFPPGDLLSRVLNGFLYGEEVADIVREAYQPGRTLGEAFFHLVRRLLEAFPILFFDPMKPRARALAAPVLRNAIEQADDLTHALLERNQRLASSGYHAQVHVEPHTSLFFLLEQGRRLSLKRKNGAYYAGERRFEPEKLRDRAESVSPSAALRPVIEDFMLPTVAYIGGPAELAYLAQSEVIYRKLLRRMPVAVSRNGFTLIDARSQKLLERYGLTLDCFFEGEEELRERIAASLTPPEIAHAFQEVSAATERNLAGLHATIEPFDKSLAGALAKSGAKIRYQLEKMQRKVARESLRRSERAGQDASYLFNVLYPQKHLQERFYTILPFLARHGLDLVGRLYENIHVDCPDHHLLFL